MTFSKYLLCGVAVVALGFSSFPVYANERPQSILPADIEPAEGGVDVVVPAQDVTFSLLPSYPQKNQGYIQSWSAQKGENIADIVARWAKQERTELSWLAEDKPVLNNDFSYVGKFPDALKELVSAASNGKLNLLLENNVNVPEPKVKPEVKQEIVKAEEIAKQIELAQTQLKIEQEAKAIAEKKAKDDDDEQLKLEIKLKELELNNKKEPHSAVNYEPPKINKADLELIKEMEAVKKQIKVEADARLAAEKKAKEEEQARLLIEKKLRELESAKASKEVVKNTTLIPDDLPKLQPLPIQEPKEIKPETKPEIKQVITKDKWFAVSGAPLKDVLTVWAEQENVKLIWQADGDFAIKNTINKMGTFEEAVSSTLNQYNNYKTRPVGEIYFDPNDNNKRVLVIKSVAE